MTQVKRKRALQGCNPPRDSLVGAPISERVEPGSEDHILPQASRDPLGQTVLGVSAAHHEPRTPLLGETVVNKLREPLLIATRGVNQTGAIGSCRILGSSSMVWCRARMIAGFDSLVPSADPRIVI